MLDKHMDDDKHDRCVAMALLGTISDASVAAFAGVAMQTAWYWRKRRGIPPFRLRTHGEYAMRYQEYLDILRASSSGMHAAAVAREMGVSREAARTMLQRLEVRGMAYRCYENGAKRPLWRVKKEGIEL